jgi:outer membrane murein-binding lipoprotein Lpp
MRCFLFLKFFSMKKFTMLVILGSLLLASCSMDSLLKKESATVPTSDDAMMKKELPQDNAMMAPEEDAANAQDEKTPADAMMKAKVEVDAAM